jgi:hypothetical protein
MGALPPKMNAPLGDIDFDIELNIVYNRFLETIS